MKPRGLKGAGIQPQAASPKRSLRCDEVVVQFIVREYDEHDRPVNEFMLQQPAKLFRGSSPDIWADADAFRDTVRRQLQQGAAPVQTSAPPAGPREA